MLKPNSIPALLFTLLFILVFTGTAFSQDDIIMLNNDVVKGRVQEVGLDLIKYHRADNPEGPLYDVRRADVYMIVYANGTHDVINAQQNNTQPTNGTGDNMPAPEDGVYTDQPVNTAPPQMPLYEQPPCPVEGYLWTPGYWAYGPLGYYWVPGVWVRPARPGYLWTPGYWAFDMGFYHWHRGYWGEHIGYYGGVYYGYGYNGSGYYGGRWEGGYFRYNTAVSRVDVTVVHTTYIDNTVVHNTTMVNRTSFNGEGGVRAEPTVAERNAMNENHVNVTAEQQSHIAVARTDKSQYVSENNGRPAVTAVNKPNGQAFSAEGHATAIHPNTAPTPASRPAQVTQPHTAQPAQPAQLNEKNIGQINKQPVQTEQPHAAQPAQLNEKNMGQINKQEAQPAQTAPAQKEQISNAPPQRATGQPKMKTAKPARGASRQAPRSAPPKQEGHH